MVESVNKGRLYR